jgi:hypothetical protein
LPLDVQQPDDAVVFGPGFGRLPTSAVFSGFVFIAFFPETHKRVVCYAGQKILLTASFLILLWCELIPAPFVIQAVLSLKKRAKFFVRLIFLTRIIMIG